MTKVTIYKGPHNKGYQRAAEYFTDKSDDAAEAEAKVMCSRMISTRGKRVQVDFEEQDGRYAFSLYRRIFQEGYSDNPSNMVI